MKVLCKIIGWFLSAVVIDIFAVFCAFSIGGGVTTLTGKSPGIVDLLVFSQVFVAGIGGFIGLLVALAWVSGRLIDYSKEK